MSLPPGRQIKFKFGFDAAWETAVCIYNGASKLVERGNYSRSRSAWQFKNTTHETVSLDVTSWHKQSGPNSGKPWMQSRYKKTLWKHPLYAIGFEDDGGSSPDFNDATVNMLMI